MRLIKRHRPSPALVISILALFVAMGGIGVAAVKLQSNSVKTKNIKNGAVTEPKLANGAVSASKLAGGFVAPDSAKLGGLAAAGYQRSCQSGAVKGSLVVDTTGFTSATYIDVGGFGVSVFNCTGGAVQMRKTAGGNYDVKFVGNDAQGAVVTVENYPNVANYQKLNPGEFHVNVFNSTTAGATDSTIFAVIVF